jgi:hypothetical protein
VKQVKAKFGLDESVSEAMFAILENMDDESIDDSESDNLGMPQEPASEQWVIMCHGQEDGEQKTEVHGPYASKEEAVNDLKDCIKDEFGDEALANVENKIGDGHVEVNGWTKVVVPLVSPDAGESDELDKDKDEKPSEEPHGSSEGSGKPAWLDSIED